MLVLAMCALGFSLDVTRTTAELSVARRNLGGAVAGGRAVFAGGCMDTGSQYACDSPTNVVDVLQPAEHGASVVKSGLALSTARGFIAGCGLGPHAVFAGGGTQGISPHSAVADVIDATAL